MGRHPTGLDRHLLQPFTGNPTSVTAPLVYRQKRPFNLPLTIGRWAVSSPGTIFFSLAGCVLVLHFDSSDHYLFHPAYRLHTNSFHHRRLRVDHSVSVTEVKRNRKEIPPAAPHAPRPWLNSGRTFLLMTAPLGSIERIDLLPTLHLYIGHNSLFSAGSKRRSRHR